MYNNFSSKKTKKVISALLASALVVTSAPITANAATAKVVGIGKTFTIKKTTKVSGLSKAEKKIVKVTVNKKKRTVTVKGVKAGKATFKIGKKAYTVMVGATSITKKTVTTNMTAGETKTLSVNAVNGKGDTIQFTSSKKGVVKVNKASAKANAKNVASTTVTAVAAGTAKITAKSKFTGKSKTFTIKVEAAAPAATNAPTVATTPGITTPTATVAATNAPSVATTPAVQTTAPAGTDAAATQNPDATKDPSATVDPNATQDPNATVDPNATQNPDATQAPSDAKEGTITITVTASGAALEGAKIQVLSGTSVVASTTSSDTTASVTAPLANGTYTVVVSKDGYVTATKSVVVNGNVEVSVDLEMVQTVEISSITATNINKYTDKAESLELTSELPTNATFSVKFSSVMNTETVNINTIKMYKVDGNIPVGVAKVSFNKTNTIATVVPADMEKNTEYKLVFTTSIASETGKNLEQTEYTFKTSAEGVLNTIYASNTHASSTSIGASATEIYRNDDVYDTDTVVNGVFKNSFAEKGDVYYIVLDSKIDAGSNTSDTVKLTNVTDGTNVNIKTELADSTDNAFLTANTYEANKVIKITLLDNLKQKKLYRFELNGVRLANGGKLTNVVYPFVTDSQAPTFNAAKTLAGDNLSQDVDNPLRVNGKLEAVNLPAVNLPAAGFGLVFNLTPETDDSTVTADAFTVTDITNKKNIPFTFTYDASLKQIKIVPVQNLPENAVIKITTSADDSIKNLLGKAMAEDEYYVQSYDLTAPTVVSVEGETTNLKVSTQHKIKVTFSEEIGYAHGYGTSNTVGAGLAPNMFVTDGTTQKLDASKAITLVKAGVDATETTADFIKIDSVELGEDKKSIEIKFTPDATDIGKTFQLILAGKNDEGRMYFCDYANATGSGKVANGLASNYNIVITTELQDVTGPQVAGIGTVDVGEPMASAFDTTKVTTFKDGAHNIDSTKDIIVQFDESLMTNKSNGMIIPLLGNGATGTSDANGNVVLEKYDDATGKWLKANMANGATTGVGSAAVSLATYNDSVEKKGAVRIPTAALATTHAKYRLTVYPSITVSGGVKHEIKDNATDNNTMSVKYVAEFTTGTVDGLDALQDPTSDAPLTVVAAAASGKKELEVSGVLNQNDMVAIELSTGDYMFTKVIEGTAASAFTKDTDVSGVTTSTVYKFTAANANVVGAAIGQTVTDDNTGSAKIIGIDAGATETDIYVTASSALAGSTDNYHINGDVTGFAPGTYATSVASSKFIPVSATTGFTAGDYLNDKVATITHVDAANKVLTMSSAVTLATLSPSVERYTYNGFVAKINDSVTATVKTDAKVFKLTNGNNVYAQYATGLEKDEPILISIGAAGVINTNTIEDSVKLYTTSDNKEVAATVKYQLTSNKKNAWVSINPTENLTPNTNYYVKVDGLKDTLGNSQKTEDANKVFSFKTAPEAKKASVSDASIYDGQMNVGVKSAFTFKVTDTTVTDFSTYLGADTITITEGADKVSLTVSYDEKTNVLTVTPDAPLTADTTCTLKIAVDAFGGTDMDKAITYSFKTSAKASAPKITSIKHEESGAAGLEGDRLVISLDSKLTSTVAGDLATPSNFGNYFDVTAGTGTIHTGDIKTVAVANDGRSIIVVFKNISNGSAVDDGITKIEAKVALTAGGGQTVSAVPFDTTAVTVTK